MLQISVLRPLLFSVKTTPLVISSMNWELPNFYLKSWPLKLQNYRIQFPTQHLYLDALISISSLPMSKLDPWYSSPQVSPPEVCLISFNNHSIFPWTHPYVLLIAHTSLPIVRNFSCLYLQNIWRNWYILIISTTITGPKCHYMKIGYCNILLTSLSLSTIDPHPHHQVYQNSSQELSY